MGDRRRYGDKLTLKKNHLPIPSHLHIPFSAREYSMPFDTVSDSDEAGLLTNGSLSLIILHNYPVG
jgi:hypothetical protein